MSTLPKAICYSEFRESKNKSPERARLRARLLFLTLHHRDGPGNGAMIKKKAKAQKAAKKTGCRRKNGKKNTDPAQVREQLAGIVKSGAKGITQAVMDHAMNGELAPAKYLLEMAGVYPPPKQDEELAAQEEDCLAKTLLDRLNIPQKAEEPVTDEPVEGDSAKDNPATDHGTAKDPEGGGDGKENAPDGSGVEEDPKPEPEA
jgi:hypothetical protein